MDRRVISGDRHRPPQPVEFQFADQRITPAGIGLNQQIIAVMAEHHIEKNTPLRDQQGPGALHHPAGC